jgi:hypothetical protein
MFYGSWGWGGVGSVGMMHFVWHCASKKQYNAPMTISLRNLPMEVERAIVEKSEKDGISLNKAAGQLLTQVIQPAAKRNSDFDEFFASWSDGDAAEFDAALASQRTVDAEEWQREL